MSRHASNEGEIPVWRSNQEYDESNRVKARRFLASVINDKPLSISWLMEVGTLVDPGIPSQLQYLLMPANRALIETADGFALADPSRETPGAAELADQIDTLVQVRKQAQQEIKNLLEQAPES